MAFVTPLQFCILIESWIYVKKITVLVISTCIAVTALAQTDGKKNIDKLCGCFDVSFKYAETFSPKKCKTQNIFLYVDYN